MKDTPIILNNFNRLTSTRNMYGFLKQRGFTNVVILDNNSTYSPLLQWYDTLRENEVVRFKENYGAECLFNSGFLSSIDSEYIVYSDSDLELNPLMPDDFLEVMKAMILKYNEKKIGLALRIDDVPEDCYKNCFTGSINWERQFWVNQLEKDIYKAMVDTTFCLMRKPEHPDFNALRIAGNFTARHLPWYLRYSELNEEELYFIEHANTQSNFRNGYFEWLNEQAKETV
ncbi:MAG: glycosyltransferase family A protein [Mucilaginibacter sp.]